MWYFGSILDLVETNLNLYLPQDNNHISAKSFSFAVIFRTLYWQDTFFSVHKLKIVFVNMMRKRLKNKSKTTILLR